MDKQKEEPRYVTAVGLDDVQLGRGRPVVTSEGNQRFRALILQYKPEYSSSNRHAHKDVVARKILSIISGRGGRFLRKIESHVERKKLAIEGGVDAWEVADEETSINKVKQALRENEPSIPSADNTLASVSSARKTKKASFVGSGSMTSTDIGKRGADSDSGKSTAGSIKSSSPKKKRKSQVAPPLSLADSIRANASKLGSDYSFFDSSDAILQSDVSATALIADIRTIKSDHVGGNKQAHINISHIDQSSNLQRLEHHLTNATTIAGNHPTLHLGRSDNQLSSNQSESVSQSNKESFVRRTIASALAVSVDKNNSIHVGVAPSDSRREDTVNVYEGIESAASQKGSSSDDEKKPAAL